jgi:hypothetical protein
VVVGQFLQKNSETHSERKIKLDNKLDLKYTSEMEKAMQQSHGVGYEEYNLKHETRMEVEQRREEEYVKSRRIVADLERKVF